MSDKEYRAALDYLYSFIDYSRTHQENISAENFELARMARFLEVLGSPHNAFPSIHIAGTKGKGSTAALCAAGLAAAGLQVGLYTSPHLAEFTERIQINAVPISQKDFAAEVDEIKPAIKKIAELTSYEIQTALAFAYFARQQVDIAVIEVGMGGRLDSTNVLTPLVSVITHISLDHTAILGETVAKIAAEKGGIIKPGVALVLATQPEEARQVLVGMAEEAGAPLTQVGIDITARPVSFTLSGQTFAITWKGQPEVEVPLGLLGAHQIENAAAAYAALQIVRQKGIAIKTEDIQRGFQQVSWPGRFEVLQTDPPVVLDAAHNPASAKVLAAACQEYFPGRPLTLVFGALADKDIAGMYAELLPITKTLLIVRPDHPRATPLESLLRLAQSQIADNHPIDNMAQVWEQALALTGPQGVLLVTGSLTTVGQLRHLWFEKQ